VISPHFPDNCFVLPGMGDHQCSIFSQGIPIPKDGIFFNFGTSAQITFLKTKSNKIEIKENLSVEVRPFYRQFGDLVTAASMNGGNVLDYFVKLFNLKHSDVLEKIKTSKFGETNLKWKSVRLFPGKYPRY
jgi:sugar (pentulose or hexulose) kinase